MNEALRKGWCPGALRPMAAKDGLLVRLRITGGILPAATAEALANLSARYGNGLFDLSARGNLQMRGVSAEALPLLQAGLRELGLIDRDAGAESVRNVIASPLAGLDSGRDIRPLVKGLEARLANDATLHALPGKFGFLIDDGSAPSLAGIDADVRFDWIAAQEHFSIGLAGGRRDALRIGTCHGSDLIASAVRIARIFLDLLPRSLAGRRMRDLVASVGADDLARACGGDRRDALPAASVTRVRDIVGRRTFEGRPVVGLAAPFGRLDPVMLHAAAALAATTPLAELRLTPWRILLVPGMPDRSSRADGFITDPEDPRLLIAACVGRDGCAHGTTSTHADATRLATHVVGTADADIVLHVSGCTKGCAKPSRSPLTFVAHDGLYDVVRNGRADDAPSQRGLDLAAACTTILEPA